jgi:hypothetical protein
MQALDPRCFRCNANANAAAERGFPIPPPPIWICQSPVFCGSFSTRHIRKLELFFTSAHGMGRVGVYMRMNPLTGFSSVSFHPVNQAIHPINGNGMEYCNWAFVLPAPPPFNFSILNLATMALEPVWWGHLYLLPWCMPYAIVVGSTIYELWEVQIQCSRRTAVAPVATHNYLNK